MTIRCGKEKDYRQLAEMKWLHGAEDDIDYGEHNLDGVEKEKFISEFVRFLKDHDDYRIFVAEENDIIISAMFVSLIPKIPRPNGKAENISYLTNVFTLKEYRNKGIGTELLKYIKAYLADLKCELILVFPSCNSIKWYERNGFTNENEVFVCELTEEQIIMQRRDFCV